MTNIKLNFKIPNGGKNILYWRICGVIYNWPPGGQAKWCHPPWIWGNNVIF